MDRPYGGHNKTPILCVELNKYYENPITCGRDLGLDPGSINGCLTYRIENYKNLHFEYVEDMTWDEIQLSIKHGQNHPKIARLFENF